MENKKVLLAGDTIDNHDIDKLIEWLKTYPRLTKGPLTEKFEAEWADYVGTKQSVFVNSGSSANLLVLSAMIEAGIISRGDEVVVPALSWSTDLAPVIQLGLKPILCDCNLDDLSIDLSHFTDIISKNNPKALILVSVLGLVPDMASIVDICRDNNIQLVEDTCESIGAEFMGQKLGSFGLAGTFSTYFGHHISTIEGGMITTNNEDFTNVLKATRSHGWDRDMDHNQQQNLRKKYNIHDFNSMYTFYYCGYNLRSTDLQAFIGLGQLDKLKKVIEKRNHNFFRYYNELELPWKPKIYPDRRLSNFAYPIIHPRKDEIVQSLLENSIEVRPLICGSLGLQPYWIKYNGAPTNLRNAGEADLNGFYIPNHALLTKDEISRVIDCINKFQ